MVARLGSAAVRIRAAGPAPYFVKRIEMTRNQLSTGRAQHRLDRRIAWGLIVGYPLLYLLGYLSKSVAGSAAIWPAHAIAFAAFMLLSLRAWPLIVLGMISWEVFARPVLYWVTIQGSAPLTMSLTYALA